MTDGYLLENAAQGKVFIEHNMNVLNVPAEKRGEMRTAFAELEADIANDATTMAQRSEYVSKVAALNQEFVDAAADPALNLNVSQKLIGFDYDAAFPTLLKNLMKPGITWFVLAALFGAVVSSLASMLNSASTIFTMDIFHKLSPSATPKQLVTVGKIGILVCVIIAMALAPFLGSPVFGGIFNFIQEFQGFISPGVLCVFLFGFFVPKCPRVFGWLGILLNVVLYGTLKWLPATADIPFLNRMSICLIVCILVGALLTAINAARGGQAVIVPVKNEVPLESSVKAKAFGAFVIVATLALYAIFW